MVPLAFFLSTTETTDVTARSLCKQINAVVVSVEWVPKWTIYSSLFKPVKRRKFFKSLSWCTYTTGLVSLCIEPREAVDRCWFAKAISYFRLKPVQTLLSLLCQRNLFGWDTSKGIFRYPSLNFARGSSAGTIVNKTGHYIGVTNLLAVSEWLWLLLFAYLILCYKTCLHKVVKLTSSLSRRYNSEETELSFCNVSCNFKEAMHGEKAKFGWRVMVKDYFGRERVQKKIWRHLFLGYPRFHPLVFSSCRLEISNHLTLSFLSLSRHIMSEWCFRLLGIENRTFLTRSPSLNPLVEVPDLDLVKDVYWNFSSISYRFKSNQIYEFGWKFTSQKSQVSFEEFQPLIKQNGQIWTPNSTALAKKLHLTSRFPCLGWLVEPRCLECQGKCAGGDA